MEWRKVRDYGSPVASDSTGKNLIATGISFNDNIGRIYISHDFGDTWIEKAVGEPIYDEYNDDYYETDWQSVDSDSKGKNLIAIDSQGYVYISHDFGDTWIEKQPAGECDETQPFTVASDADGKNLIAADSQGYVYISHDYGETWVEKLPMGQRIDPGNKVPVASDSDGSNLIIGIYNYAYGGLFISNDFGETWTKIRPDDRYDWTAVASDADGSNLAAVDSRGHVYISHDYGNNWIGKVLEDHTDTHWGAVASDSDGSNLIIGIKGGRLYISNDFGDTWAETQPDGDRDRDWLSVDSDADGSNLIVSDEAGQKTYVSGGKNAFEPFTRTFRKSGFLMRGEIQWQK